MAVTRLRAGGRTHPQVTVNDVRVLEPLVRRPRLYLIRFHGVLAPNAKLRPAIIPSRPPTRNDAADDPNGDSPHLTTARMRWARLLKPVFDIDVEHCPHCGGTLKIIASIEEPSVIVKILAHLCLPARALPRSFDLSVTA